jgi:rubredoxin
MLCPLCGMPTDSPDTYAVCRLCWAMPIQPQPNVEWTCPTCGARHQYFSPVQYTMTTAPNAAPAT